MSVLELLDHISELQEGVPQVCSGSSARLDGMGKNSVVGKTVTNLLKALI